MMMMKMQQILLSLSYDIQQLYTLRIYIYMNEHIMPKIYIYINEIIILMIHDDDDDEK